MIITSTKTGRTVTAQFVVTENGYYDPLDGIIYAHGDWADLPQCLTEDGTLGMEGLVLPKELPPTPEIPDLKKGDYVIGWTRMECIIGVYTDEDPDFGWQVHGAVFSNHAGAWTPAQADLDDFLVYQKYVPTF